MKLDRAEIENYRAIEKLSLPLHERLKVLHGANGHGKTSVLSAIAVGLAAIPRLLPDVSSIGFRKTDLREDRQIRVALTTTNQGSWNRRMGGEQRGREKTSGLRDLRNVLNDIIDADRKGRDPIDLPIVAFYDTDRAVFDAPRRRRGFNKKFPRCAALEGALESHTRFRELLKLFYAKEDEGLRIQRRGKHFS